MELLHSVCAGLDVHKDSVVACLRKAKGRKTTHEVRTFGTMTADLLALGEWLERESCTDAVMESTGVYWKPVWHILETDLKLVLANAAHVRNVPGRKSDVNDATWLADLLAHGLVSGSFVPPQPIVELRDLTRTRKQVGREIVRYQARIQKVLETANIKLDSVISDVLGKSGRKMLQGLVDGKDPKDLAALAHPKVRASADQLERALTGRVTPHHRFMLRFHLEQIESAEGALASLEEAIEEHMRPFGEAAARLESIPGISRVAAEIIIAETGGDMSQFATSGQLLSWAGLVPGLHESAGKAQNTRIRDGNPWLKPLLVQAAWCAFRKKNCYLRAQFLRLSKRRGAKKAAVAVAASILTACYHMLRDGTFYEERGGDYFERRSKESVARGLTKKLERLGYTVNLEAIA